MNIKKSIRDIFDKKDHKPKFMALDFVKYIGPGLLVTVGFIDPGNWAANVAAGATYGYNLLWIVVLSTIMLVILQHNAAHLGIATGLCISEAATKYLKPKLSRFLLFTAVLAAISTAMAEILGAAIALNMLFRIPLKLAAVMSTALCVWLVFSNSYKKIEKIIIGFVSLIGLSFIFELIMVKIDWITAAKSSFIPSIPTGSLLIIVSVLGAVVMPHNLFLHSEVIQSRQWNLEDEKVIEKQLKYEFLDTLFSMIIGWAINSAMILVAAAAFFSKGIKVTELQQAEEMLRPILGNAAAMVFAAALLFAGIASCITACMASGSIFAGIFSEPYDISDRHTKIGIGITMFFALIIILFISEPFKGLVISQMLLSMQLPFTIFLLIYLTSSKKVMGSHSNKKSTTVILVVIGAIVTILNVMLIVNTLLGK